MEKALVGSDANETPDGPSSGSNIGPKLRERERVVGIHYEPQGGIPLCRGRF